MIFGGTVAATRSMTRSMSPPLRLCQLSRSKYFPSECNIPQAIIREDNMVSPTVGSCQALRKSPDGLSISNAKKIIGYKQVPGKGQEYHVTHRQGKRPDKGSQKMTPESNQEVLARQSPRLFEEAHIKDHVACQLTKALFCVYRQRPCYLNRLCGRSWLR